MMSGHKCDAGRAEIGACVPVSAPEDWRQISIALAKEVIVSIADELARFKLRAKGNATREARIKSLLDMIKAIQSLEDMITRLELALDEAGNEPLDAVAFHESLSQKLEAIAFSGAERVLSSDIEPE